jgi:hypothetical protein
VSVSILDVVVRVGLVLATTFLLGIVASAYFRLRNRKMLFIFVGFAIFFVHAVISLPALARSHSGHQRSQTQAQRQRSQSIHYDRTESFHHTTVPIYLMSILQ